MCLAPVPVAIEHGYFQKHNLDVELVNYSGSTDQLLEAIATGKSDAGLGMALRWLKPLEQGFDVKIAAGTHGGCMRVLSHADSGVSKLADLKGKIVAVGDLAGPDKNFFSIQLAKLGIDPNKDIDWRAYPGNLLNVAVEKGEVQAFLSSDPLAYLFPTVEDGARGVKFIDAAVESHQQRRVVRSYQATPSFARKIGGSIRTYFQAGAAGPGRSISRMTK